MPKKMPNEGIGHDTGRQNRPAGKRKPETKTDMIGAAPGRRSQSPNREAARFSETSSPGSSFTKTLGKIQSTGSSWSSFGNS
jgi:hypothetical protein